MENKCVELQLDLEEQGLEEEEVEAQVDALRQKLLKEDVARGPGPLKPHECRSLTLSHLLCFYPSHIHCCDSLP